MPKMQIVTDTMLSRAGIIGQNADRILASQNAVSSIFQSMGHDFSGRVPGLMVQHMTAMQRDYNSMNVILVNYRNFMEDAARNYEWTEDELTRWAESLGNANAQSQNTNSQAQDTSTSAQNTGTQAQDTGTPVQNTDAQPQNTGTAAQVDPGNRNPANYNYDASKYQGYVSAHGDNCYSFVNQVLKDEGRGSLSGWNNSAYLNGHDTIDGGQFIVSNGQAPSAEDIKNIFTNAQVGDVVQMRWAYQKGSTSPHTAIISNITEDGVEFLHSHISGSNVKNSTYSWAELAKRYSNVGNGGGASIYRF